MSIITASFHSLYNKLPSLSPSSLADATASTASSTYNLVKDGFYSTLSKVSEYRPNGQTLSNAASTAAAHPYLSLAGAFLALGASGLFINARRQAVKVATAKAKVAARELKHQRAEKALTANLKNQAHLYYLSLNKSLNENKATVFLAKTLVKEQERLGTIVGKSRQEMSKIFVQELDPLERKGQNPQELNRTFTEELAQLAKKMD